MANANTSETVYSPNVDLHRFHSSAAIVFGADNLRWSIKAMLEFTVSFFNMHKSCKSFFLIFNVYKVKSIVEQFGHVNKENTFDRMPKSINPNPVGNIKSSGSSVN